MSIKVVDFEDLGKHITEKCMVGGEHNWEPEKQSCDCMHTKRFGADRYDVCTKCGLRKLICC